MKSQVIASNKETRCMECGRGIPKGMTYRKVFDKRGLYVGDHCYGKCKPMKKATVNEANICEECGLRPGQLNSQYLFHSPLSDREEEPDCGDWVCQDCEMEAELDAQQMHGGGNVESS